MSLLVAICGPEIASYRPKVEALIATRKANARLARVAGISADRRLDTEDLR